MSEFPFRDRSLPLERRGEDLISRFTPEEKAYQLCNSAPAVPRLGVPAYNYWNEALHGIARAGTATVFPQAIGLAAMFNAPLLNRVAAAISDEGRAKYNEFQRQGDHGIYKGLTFWSPNINIFRDPRWGRGHETYGEDPYLTGTLGVAFIRGLQGEDPVHLKAAACAKHFAVHSGPENLRHSMDVEIGDQELYETYLPAFEMAVREAHVESVMGAYNAVNGEPCNASTQLIGKILRGEWGFAGHVVSDCGAINDFHSGHRVTGSPAESAALGVRNGCDLCCGGEYRRLIQALEQGMITEQEIDVCLRRVFMTRFKLGMFDEPATVSYAAIPYETVGCPEHRELNREAARQSMVLLKNNGILPLKRGVKLAVIGPNADHKPALLGNYNGTPAYNYTPLEGLRKYLGEEYPLFYAQGAHHVRGANEAHESDGVSEAISVAERADVTVLCIGLDANLEGEEGLNNAYGNGDKPHIDLPAAQQKLVDALIAAGKPLVAVLMVGSALAVCDVDEHADAVISAFYPGEQGGLALAQLLFGDYAPAGRLPVTFYRTTDELPPFEEYAMKGRTYRFMENEPLYPFGYGLSYTSFKYDLPQTTLTAAAGDIAAESAPVTIPVSLTNTGGIDGDETVQVYVKAPVPGPKYELKWFARIPVKAGATANLEIALPPKAFSTVDETGARRILPGAYTIYIGGSQPDKRSQELTGQAVGAVELQIAN
ncbi:MAG: glycoside hydrolase family 3 C-terminal domain-containing protein [Oscillospiraceae bacterium]|nr:glycoside hydrolase family 3 C-terminal domain-containing protein [Oscillospiraceae bacterium]